MDEWIHTHFVISHNFYGMNNVKKKEKWKKKCKYLLCTLLMSIHFCVLIVVLKFIWDKLKFGENPKRRIRRMTLTFYISNILSRTNPSASVEVLKRFNIVESWNESIWFFFFLEFLRNIRTKAILNGISLKLWMFILSFLVAFIILNVWHQPAYTFDFGKTNAADILCEFVPWSSNWCQLIWGHFAGWGVWDIRIHSLNPKL